MKPQEKNIKNSLHGSDSPSNQKNSDKKIFLKAKIINSLMISGKKETGEKILSKLVKFLQRSTNKNIINLIQLSIINSTPIFKLNEQIIKKGKRKATKVTPSFISKNSLRTMLSLKLMRKIASKNKSSNSFYTKLGKEIVASAQLKSASVERKNELQKQVLLNKRYISKFRW